MVHYLTTEGKEIYRGTHVKKAVDNCFVLAGNDDELRAACIGWGLHLTQDIVSHEGYTPKYIKKFLSTNLIMHPPTERRVTKNLLREYPEDEERVIELTRTNCDIFSRDPKFLKILNDATGMDLTNDVQIVDSALKGTGRYDSEQVWGKKVDLPNWWYYVVGSILALSLLIFIALAIFAVRFKIFLMVVWVIIGLIAGAVLLSLLLGTSYIWYNSIVDVVGIFISVPDWQDWWLANQKSTIDYLDTGVLKTTDASGLTHFEGNTRIPGALTDAESLGKTVSTIALIIGALVLVALTFFAFYPRKRRK